MTQTDDPYRNLAILAEGAGFERRPITYSGAHFRRAGVRIRMVIQGDPGSLLIKATYDNGYRIAELDVQLGEVPAPATLNMVRAFLRGVGSLARPDVYCASTGCGALIVSSTEGGWVHGATGQRQCDLVQSGRAPTYAHPPEVER